jgi:hypothetical protein
MGRLTGFRKALPTTSGFVQLGHDVESSSAAHLQALVLANGILPGICWLTSAFNYKFSISSGQTVGQFPTAQSLERYRQCDINSKLILKIESLCRLTI